MTILDLYDEHGNVVHRDSATPAMGQALARGQLQLSLRQSRPANRSIFHTGVFDLPGAMLRPIRDRRVRIGRTRKAGVRVSQYSQETARARILTLAMEK